MSKRQILMLIGLWIMAILHLGLPELWDKMLLFITGIVIIFTSFKIKETEIKAVSEPQNFVDHKVEIKSENTGTSS